MAEVPPTNPAARRVFHGLVSLEPEQADKVLDAYHEYRRLPRSEQRRAIEKSAPRVSLGPLSGVCLYCGR